MTEYNEHERAAYELGVEHAKNAASWAVDGAMSTKDIERRLSALDSGDPFALDLLPREPNLSGEFADDPTPASLFEQVTGRGFVWSTTFEPDHDELMDTLADAYEAGVSDTFQPECERILRAAMSS